MSEDAQIVFVLTGETAVGKKDVGLAIARRHDCEIVAVDSIKVYRGLVIGGAQPTASDLGGITAHLIGTVDPGESFSVGRWVKEAAQAVAAIRRRGKRPLFLGGTPLYLNALLRGFFDGPASDPKLRAELEGIADRDGVPTLHARLEAVDPDSAAWIGKNDSKRIVRALEVHAMTGTPISRLQREQTRRMVDGEFKVAGITAANDFLRQRQAARVDRMLERGLVDEVRMLLAAGTLRGEAARAIGYREIIDHLQEGSSLEAARSLIVRNTWELTRKQRKWFRKLNEITFVERLPTMSLETLIDEVDRVLTSARTV